MPTLGNQLQKVATQLQRKVAPGVGDSIIEVWRQKTTPGAGRDASGNELSSGTANVGLVGTYYARFTHNAEGGEPLAGGQPLSVLPYIFIFNAGAAPDVQGSDILLEAAKRDVSLAIEDLGWQPNKTQFFGTREQPTGESELYAVALNSGTTGAIEPDWPQVVGETVMDGSIEWEMAAKRSFSVIDPGGRETINVEYIVVAQDSREGDR